MKMKEALINLGYLKYEEVNGCHNYTIKAPTVFDESIITMFIADEEGKRFNFFEREVEEFINYDFGDGGGVLCLGDNAIAEWCHKKYLGANGKPYIDMGTRYILLGMKVKVNGDKLDLISGE